jgi:hypothetical protein
MNYGEDDLYPIEEGFELPSVDAARDCGVSARERLYATLIALEVGQSFVIHLTGLYQARRIAEHLKMALVWKKIEPPGAEFPRFRVWLAQAPPGGNGEFPPWEQVKLIFKRKSKQA